MTKAEDFIHDTGYFASKDGLQIFYQSWRPRDRERAALCVAHGLGEHSGRYGNLVDKLVPRGFGVFALDHRGHGRSHGKRGHVDAFSQYIDDLDVFMDIVQSKSNGPFFLFGHSMGGLIALSYAILYPEKISGVVSSSAALKLALEVPKFK
ncbi:MAG TPA: alpha/beta fold hydrolase, partial [Proteobacteria bacterium]|nr:alpha/beta fold hydrolase [Pseudomonadota bacterium]